MENLVNGIALNSNFKKSKKMFNSSYRPCSNGFGNFKFYSKIQQKMLDWGYKYSIETIKN